jgi:hypothetical protein
MKKKKLKNQKKSPKFATTMTRKFWDICEAKKSQRKHFTHHRPSSSQQSFLASSASSWFFVRRLCQISDCLQPLRHRLLSLLLLLLLHRLQNLSRFFLFFLYSVFGFFGGSCRILLGRECGGRDGPGVNLVAGG